MPKKMSQHELRQRTVSALFTKASLENLQADVEKAKNAKKVKVGRLGLKMEKKLHDLQKDDRFGQYEINDIEREINNLKVEIEEEADFEIAINLDEIKAFALNYDNEDEAEFDQPEFFNQLFDGVLENSSDLTAKISEHLAKNWSFERLARIEQVILQIGVFEILNSETPDVVAINEAIELAKDFSDEKSSKFINGVLTNLIKK